MKRREFITKAGLGTAGAVGAAALATPAIAQERIEMAIVATWGRDFPGLGTGAQRYAQKNPRFVRWTHSGELLRRK